METNAAYNSTNAESNTDLSTWTARPVKVLLDGRKAGQGGIGVYIENLIQGLLTAEETVRLSVILPPGEAARHSWTGRVEVIEDRARLYSLDELFGLPRRLDLKRFDLFHSPHFTLPFRLPIPGVVTIHDLIHIYHPQKKFYPLIARPLILSALKRASAIITVSESTRNDLLRLAGNRSSIAERITVVPNALDPFFLQPTAQGYLNNRFRLNGPYLLAVISMLKPHKGMADLLAAFGDLKARLQILKEQNGALAKMADIKLVVVGQGAERLVDLGHEHLFRKSGEQRDVIVLGRVGKQDLLHLYRYAGGLVMPSRAEGFSLPVLEARSFGTLVVARPVPAAMELLGQHDIVCRDFSCAALASGMEQLLLKLAIESPVDEANRRAGAREFAQRFQCTGISEQVLKLYRQVALEK